MRQLARLGLMVLAGMMSEGASAAVKACELIDNPAFRQLARIEQLSGPEAVKLYEALKTVVDGKNPGAIGVTIDYLQLQPVQGSNGNEVDANVLVFYRVTATDARVGTDQQTRVLTVRRSELYNGTGVEPVILTYENPTPGQSAGTLLPGFLKLFEPQAVTIPGGIEDHGDGFKSLGKDRRVNRSIVFFDKAGQRVETAEVIKKLLYFFHYRGLEKGRGVVKAINGGTTRDGLVIDVSYQLAPKPSSYLVEVAAQAVGLRVEIDEREIP